MFTDILSSSSLSLVSISDCFSSILVCLLNIVSSKPCCCCNITATSYFHAEVTHCVSVLQMMALVQYPTAHHHTMSFQCNFKRQVTGVKACQVHTRAVWLRLDKGEVSGNTVSLPVVDLRSVLVLRCWEPSAGEVENSRVTARPLILPEMAREGVHFAALLRVPP